VCVRGRHSLHNYCLWIAPPGVPACSAKRLLQLPQLTQVSAHQAVPLPCSSWAWCAATAEGATPGCSLLLLLLALAPAFTSTAGEASATPAGVLLLLGTLLALTHTALLRLGLLLPLLGPASAPGAAPSVAPATAAA
jgi:hypothetical protein